MMSSKMWTNNLGNLTYKVLKFYLTQVKLFNYILCMINTKDRYQTSFVVDKKLWIKFKSKTLKEGVSIKDKLHSLMTDYVNNKETTNARNWFSLPRWK